MKRFTVPCDFNGVKHPFHVYIGEPHPKKHPLQFQAWWLSSERGGTIPQDVMDSFEKLFKISQENNVSFEDLCVYALGTAAEEEGSEGDATAGAAPATPAASSPTPDAPPPPAEEPAAQASSEDYDPVENNPIPSPDAGGDDFMSDNDSNPFSDDDGSGEIV